MHTSATNATPRRYLQVPHRIRRSKLVVKVLPRKPLAPPAPQEQVGHAAEVWPGITSRELAQALAPLSSAAVLDMR
jgi:hypothetical protein